MNKANTNLNYEIQIYEEYLRLPNYWFKYFFTLFISLIFLLYQDGLN
jgi:hypothetical protein